MFTLISLFAVLNALNAPFFRNLNAFFHLQPNSFLTHTIIQSILGGKHNLKYLIVYIG